MYSNYLNHHQLPLCEALITLTGGQFKFVAEDPITQVRLHLGYEDMNQKDFVIRAYESEEAKAKAEALARESDIIIVGAASDKYIRIRNKIGKPSFKYSERPFKRLRSFFSPKVWFNLHKNQPVYMLCIGDYCAEDYRRIGAYKNKCYRWGYFPAQKDYVDEQALLQNKKDNAALWVGRFIKCKHAEHVIKAAERLKNEGYEFTIEMLGIGEQRPQIRKTVAEKGLRDFVKFPGQVSPEVVRCQMDKYPILLITSDRYEGWGAVVNEAMDSGCAVLASNLVGSAATIINEGKNGLLYRFGDIDELCRKLKYLMENKDAIKELGAAARKTVSELWNAEVAAERLYALCEAILSGQESPDLFAEGVCSKTFGFNK